MCMEKQVLKVGDKGYLRQFTGNYWVDMVKRPYTVIEATPTRVVVQECRLIYPIFQENPFWTKEQKEYYKDMVGKRVCFYDTIAESIEPDPFGRTMELSWHPKRELWGEKNETYPQFFIVGEYEHQPYLD